MDVSGAVRPIVNVIMETIRSAFRRLPPEMTAEVGEGGVCLIGGGACVPGMKDLIAEATSLDVKVAADPLRAVINGAGRMLAAGEWHPRRPAAMLRL